MSNRSRKSRTVRLLTGLCTCLVATSLVGACSATKNPSGAESPPTTPPSPPTGAPTASVSTGEGSAAAEASNTSGTVGGTGGGNGCLPNDSKIPTGAARGTTGDLDLDGASDTLWLTGPPQRSVGVTTATGATFSIPFKSPDPQSAAALGQKMGPAGPAIILLNTGRSVYLYTIVDCHLVPTLNDQGGPYTFDLGFAGVGTGVECLPGADSDSLVLAGLNVVQNPNGTFSATETAIELDDFGRHATNGETRTAADVPANNSTVSRAHTVTCGTQPQLGEPL